MRIFEILKNITVEDGSSGGAGGASGGTTGAGAIGGAPGSIGQVGIANLGPFGVGTGGIKPKKGKKKGSKTPNPAGGLVPYGKVEK